MTSPSYNRRVLLAFILLIVLAVAVVVIIWGHRSARATGMSPTQPVCARCLYRLGGWSSPVCPECGSDVRKVGVRTGPQTSRTVAAVLVVLCSLFGIGPFVGMGVGWLFAQRSGHAHARYESESGSRFFVTLETDFRWRRFPPLHDHHTRLVFTRLFASSSGAWHNGRYVGSTPVPVRTVEFDERGPLDSAAVQDAVAATLAEVADEEAVTNHAQAAKRLVAMIVAAQADESFNLNTLLRAKASPLRSSGSGGSGGGGSQMHVLGILPILLTIAFCIWLGLGAVRRWCRPGWRPVCEGEWGIAPRPPSTRRASAASCRCADS